MPEAQTLVERWLKPIQVMVNELLLPKTFKLTATCSIGRIFNLQTN